MGLVFQYPEHQLFEVDVFSDVCFGPKNLGLPKEEIEKRAKEALDMVGLDESFYKQSPFDLSGGQKQRVAIGRALINEPDIIFGDEPTGSLDRKTTGDVMRCMKQMNQRSGISFLLVTHDAYTASFCDRVLFLQDGNLAKEVKKENTADNFREDIWKTLCGLGGGKDDLF